MDESECTTAYNHLVKYLQDNGLTWVVDQVNNILALGKISTKKVKPFRDLAERSASPSTHEQAYMLMTVGHSLPVGSETELTTSSDYSPQERLVILIEAIENAVIETVAMEHDTIETLNSMNDQGVNGIIFVSEQNANERHGITADNVSRKRMAGQLHQMLLQLKDGIS